jgi:hypothetical protein
MNGQILRLQSNGSIPPLRPKVIKVNHGIELPRYSIIFLLIHMEIPACLEL